MGAACYLNSEVNIVKDIYPSYYKKFKCIANLCPDSCCKDWDIDVDSETEKFYNTVHGELGDKIRRLTITDKYGERVFINNGVRCPFWNDDMLCDIYIGLGEEHMSETCRRFPRITLEYDGFREQILSFACPEAARLMLLEDNAYRDFGGSEELNTAEQSEDYFSFLIKARERSAQILLNEDQPMIYRISDCLDFNTQIQLIIDGEEPCPLNLDENKHHNSDYIIKEHLKLEIMSEGWKNALELALNLSPSEPSENFDKDFEKYSLYLLYRYYLGAESTGDVLFSIKRIACAYIVTSRMDSALENTPDRPSRLRVLQRYSKEIEHSYENDAALGKLLTDDNTYSVEQLIEVLDNLYM